MNAKGIIIGLSLLGNLLVFLFVLIPFLFSRFGSSTEMEEKWMKKTISYAEAAKQRGQTGIAAILVLNDREISFATGGASSENHLKHVETTVINDALIKLNQYRLDRHGHKAIIYTTFEPCPLCRGFAHYKGLEKFVVSEGHDLKRFSYDFFGYYSLYLNQKTNVMIGTLKNKNLILKLKK